MLADAMRAERLRDRLQKRERSARSRCLGFGKFQLAVNALERRSNVNGAGLEINIRPLECQYFATPKSERHVSR